MHINTKTVRVEIPESAWESIGWEGVDSAEIQNRDRLLAQVSVCGTWHHLEAYRVAYDDDGCMVLANPDMERELMPTLQDLYNGCYETTTIGGHEYVLFMFPHAD